MVETVNGLGRLVSVHSTAPVFLQRAAIVAMVSFTFFLAMLLGFYVRHHFGYFLLATAFLVLGWWMQKRNILKIYENGISYKKFTIRWDEVAGFHEEAGEKSSVSMTLTDQNKRSVTIPSTIDRVEQASALIRSRIAIRR
jgi:hypothetical protein